MTKLSKEQVDQIRELLKEGKLLHSEIASQFGVTRFRISAINNNRTWVEGEKGVKIAKNSRSKLTDDDVKKIRQLLKDGIKQREIAEMFGVKPNTISGINTGQYHKPK